MFVCILHISLYFQSLMFSWHYSRVSGTTVKTSSDSSTLECIYALYKSLSVIFSHVWLGPFSSWGPSVRHSLPSSLVSLALKVLCV